METPTGPRMSDAPKFTLAEKLIQGLGGAVDSARGAVVMLVLFYYNAILGVPAHLVGAALAFTVLVDAVTDPMIGSWSDNTITRLGRRHPFMYASILPLALSLYALLSPPAGLGEAGLLFWILAIGVCVSISFTLFQVPFLAMLSELTDDYDERTKLNTYRYTSTLLGAGVCEIVIYRFFLPATEQYPQGQFNPAGYPSIALAGALFAVFLIFVTTYFTRKRIPYLPKAAPNARASLSGMFRDTKDVLGNRNFRLLFLSILMASLSFGATENMGKHMAVFFWELTSEQQQVIAIGALGFLVAVVATAYLQKFFEKKTLVLGAFIVFFLTETALVTGRFLDIIPQNGSDELVILLTVSRAIRVGAIVLAAIYYGSLLGDIVLEHEYNTGRRQSGSMFAGLGFAEKAVAGLGVLLAGSLISLSGLPSGDVVSAVEASAEQTRNLGLAYGYGIPLLGIVPLLLISQIDLKRKRFEEIKSALETRTDRV